MRMVKEYLGVVIVLLWTCSAHAVTYEDVWTEKAGQAYDEDPNVWVYSKEFAARFGMPEAWIDADLKGAYAVAFRVETFDVRIRLPHKEKNKGMPVRRCFLNVFVPEDASIPWIDNQLSGIRFETPDAPVYLIPQSEQDRLYRESSLGIESPGKKARRPLIHMGVKPGAGRTLLLTKFNRKLYPGITFMSFSMGCMTPPQKKVWIEFMEDKSWVGYEAPVIHAIEVPARFMLRVHENWYERSRRHSEKEYREIM